MRFVVVLYPLHCIFYYTLPPFSGRKPDSTRPESRVETETLRGGVRLLLRVGVRVPNNTPSYTSKCTFTKRLVPRNKSTVDDKVFSIA